MVNERYYDGFEGDEEICIRLLMNEVEVESIGIWGGYFSSIIKLIPPQNEGWTGFAYYFHLNIGWYDEENWEVPDIPLFYKQLCEIDESMLSYNEDILDNPSVAQYIRELSEKAQDERIMTAKERQALLSDMAKDGENAPADRIRAIDTLNKMTGEYVAKIQAEVKTSEKLSEVFAQIGGEGLDDA